MYGITIMHSPCIPPDQCSLESNAFVQFIQKYCKSPPCTAPGYYYDPQVVLDYRCYLPGGKEEIGTDYPPKARIAFIYDGMHEH